MIGSVVVSQLGARNHYAIPRVLAGAGRLERLYTDICGSVGWPRLLGALPHTLQPPAIRRLVGRKPLEVPNERIISFQDMALEFIIRRCAARNPSDVTAAFIWVGKRFSELAVRRGFGEAAGLIGYNSACCEQFQAARAQGLWTAVDQTIVPSAMLTKLIEEESEFFPGWASPVAVDLHAEEFAARERTEWEQADVIFCGSEFVRRGVADSGGPAHRCVVVPYGVDTSFSLPVRMPHPGPLHVLTIGEVGLRKGSPSVLAAARRLKRRAVFRIVGPCALPARAREAMQADVELTGQVPRSEIRAHFAWADVFDHSLAPNFMAAPRPSLMARAGTLPTTASSGTSWPPRPRPRQSLLAETTPARMVALGPNGCAPLDSVGTASQSVPSCRALLPSTTMQVQPTGSKAPTSPPFSIDAANSSHAALKIRMLDGNPANSRYLRPTLAPLVALKGSLWRSSLA